MLKQNRGRIINTSLIILLPCLIGIAMWQRLPESIAVHFGPDGSPDSFAPRWVAVFVLPLSMLAGHLFCMLYTLSDPKRSNIGRKPLALLFWLVPVTSLVVNVCIYASTLNVQINISAICTLLMGVIFLAVGNILPKLGQNYSFGIRTSWSLADPGNWAYTHRVGGRAWALAGLVLLVTGLWLPVWAMLLLLTVAVAVPLAGSYLYYRRHREQS